MQQDVHTEEKLRQQARELAAQAALAGDATASDQRMLEWEHLLAAVGPTFAAERARQQAELQFVLRKVLQQDPARVVPERNRRRGYTRGLVLAAAAAVVLAAGATLIWERDNSPLMQAPRMQAPLEAHVQPAKSGGVRIAHGKPGRSLRFAQPARLRSIDGKIVVESLAVSDGDRS